MPPVPRIEVDVKELDEILERCRSSLDERDHEKLSGAVDTLRWLTDELEAKRVSVARLKKALFGDASEKTAKLFPGTEEPTADGERAGEDDAEAPKKKQKPRGHGRNGAEKYKGAKKIEVKHPTLRPGDDCPSCDGGKVYSFTPARIVRIRGQAPIQAEVYELEKLRCNLCSEIFTADPPEGMGEEKYDATSASMIALLKYGSGLPFNRLERLEQCLGIPLPAATQWDVVHHAARRLQPAFEELVNQAAQGEVLHNDDTGMKILELMGKRWKKKQAKSKKKGKGSSKSKERTGTFTSGIVSVGEGRKIMLFFTGRKHAGENLSDVLSRRAEALDAPVQMCDALSRNMPADLEAVIANCMAHARRQFVDISASFPEECRRVLETIGKVYRNDATARERSMTPEERLAYHRQHSAPLLVKLRRRFQSEIRKKQIEPNSSLGAAIGYLKSHWRELTRFYRHPGVPLDNNLVERALKKAILHRKNALFYKSENGARVGDLYMSLIYTAEVSGENPFDYLSELCRHAEEIRENPGAWMPWSYRATIASPADDASSVPPSGVLPAP